MTSTTICNASKHIALNEKPKPNACNGSTSPLAAGVTILMPSGFDSCVLIPTHKQIKKDNTDVDKKRYNDFIFYSS